MTFKHKAQGDMSLEEAPLGYCLLSRDHQTWGDEGTGSDAIDPEGECDGNYCPHYNHMDHDSMNDTIHLHIASFRDQLCPRTLYNLFHKAANPSRIYVRVLQQVEHDSDKIDDADCWQMFCKKYGTDNCELYKEQVLVLTMNAKNAKGPTDPRSKLTALLEHDYLHTPAALHPVHPQDYCMQTDSHMDFTQDFDVKLIEMFHRTHNDYAVLSTYVAPMDQTDVLPKEVPHLCMVTYTGTWRNWGTKSCTNLVRPKMTNVAWGAGLSFSKCHADLNVPYDPFLPNVFDGEEISRGFRYFTHGYDVYTPDQVLVTHDYDGHQSNPNVHTWGGLSIFGKEGELSDGDSDLSFFMKDINDQTEAVEPKGRTRINVLLGFVQDDALFNRIAATKYGHGDRRTLQQAIEFSGFDPEQKKMVKNCCGNLKWVPFEEADDNFGLEKNLQRIIWDDAPHVQHDLILVNATEQPNLRNSTVVRLLIVMVCFGIFVRKRLDKEFCRAKKSERMQV